MATVGEEATHDMLRMVKKGESINGVTAKDVLTVKNANGKMLLIPTNFFKTEDLTKQQQKAIGFVGVVEGKCDYPPQTRPRPYPHISPRARRYRADKPAFKVRFADSVCIFYLDKHPAAETEKEHIYLTNPEVLIVTPYLDE